MINSPAYREGYAAYVGGYRPESNPYQPGTSSYFDWDFGWCDAWEDEDTADY